MQLTKDDFITTRTGLITGIKYSKFKQVVRFYKRYRDSPALLMKEHPEVVKILLYKEDCIDKLFDYCFKDGLK